MTGDLVLIVLKIKLIVIGQLLSFGDSPAGDDNNFVLLVKCHNLCYTVRGTGVVNVPGRASSQGGINHMLIVYPKHVNASILLLIDFLPPVGHLIANDGANVLDDHCMLLQVLGCIEPEALDP